MNVEEIQQHIDTTKEKVGNAINGLIQANAFLDEANVAMEPAKGSGAEEVGQSGELRAAAMKDITALERKVRTIAPLLNTYMNRIGKGAPGPAPPDTSGYTRTDLDPVDPDTIREPDTIRPRGSGRHANRPLGDRSGIHPRSKPYPE